MSVFYDIYIRICFDFDYGPASKIRNNISFFNKKDQTEVGDKRMPIP